MTTTNGFLSLLPFILDGLSAADGLAGGTVGIAQAVQNMASDATNAQAECLNWIVEAELKGRRLYLQHSGCCPDVPWWWLVSFKKLEPLSNSDIKTDAKVILYLISIHA